MDQTTCIIKINKYSVFLPEDLTDAMKQINTEQLAEFLLKSSHL